MLKRITQYYGVWEPAPTTGARLLFLENVLMPKVSFEQLTATLQLRGIVLGQHTKEELMEIMGEALTLETKNLEESVVKALREMERDIDAYDMRNQLKRANNVKAATSCLVACLLLPSTNTRDTCLLISDTA